MTVKEFENGFSKLGIQLKRKAIVSDNQEITIDDINKTNTYQKFCSSDNLLKIIDGLIVINDDIAYCEAEIDSLDIDTDDIFKICNGKQTIEVYANYIVKLISYNGIKYAPLMVGRSRVSALIKIDNNDFFYEKPLIIMKENDFGEDSININATYYHKGRKYEASKGIFVPKGNTTHWRLENELTDEIKLFLSKQTISYKGGAIGVTVGRYFHRDYVLEDECGNVVDKKTESGLLDNTFDKHILTTSDNTEFIVKDNNMILVNRQGEESETRECIVTAIYDGKKGTAVITQLGTSEVTKYVQELSFTPDDGNVNKAITLITYLPSYKNINIVSKTQKWIDGVYKSSSVTDNLTISSDSDWLKCNVYKDGENVILGVHATEANLSKKSDRTAVVTIVNNNDTNKRLTLVVTQPHIVVQKIFLNVSIIYNKAILDKDIVTSNVELIIDDNYIVKLKPGWINPNMKEYKDTIYQGYIELEEGTHTFKTNELLYDNKEYIISGEIVVDKNLKDTSLDIEI